MTTRDQLESSNAVVVHADLSASSAYRWWNCPGSIWMIRLLPFMPPPTIYARRGTAMHKALAQWLITKIEPQWDLERFDGFDLEQDEVEAVQTAFETILDDQNKYGGELVVEHRFSLATLREGMFGTNDAMLVGCIDGVLRVYDFKGGKGVVVEVRGNLQLLYYGYGAVLTVKGITINFIELIIVQPRAPHPDGPVRRWRIDLIDAFDWSHDLLTAAARTDDPKAPLHAGDWCKFCPAIGVCEEHQRYAYQQAALEFDDDGIVRTLPDPKMMTPEQIAKLLPGLHILKDWMEAVWAWAHAEAEMGRCPSGFKLVAKRGRRQWTVDENQVVSIITQLGVKEDQLFKRELRSPHQMEKLLRKQDRPIINKIAAMFSSGTNLVPFDDARDAVEGTGLAVFSALPEGEPEK